ncbi:MAG: hypothetical protein FD143_436 [Ignavibacteria bacterium]|nr:MAG: hypothetical protein FD143_436 [Ignavibacteria bacterium]KAF0161507.1 MAG: hypothetical protein FD188_624 [Ignavibacteria bacterium]
MDNISVGIALFNDCDFFAAHDFFEHCWMDCEQADRNFYQGLVQVSVGSYHLISGNYKGCLSQYKKSSKKLSKYLPVHQNINLALLLNAIEPITKDLGDSLKNVDPKMFGNRIPKIEVTK